MGQAEKSQVYKALKADGWENDKHFRNYSETELNAIYGDRFDYKGTPPVLGTLPPLPPTPEPSDPPPKTLKELADEADLARALSAKRALSKIQGQKDKPPLRAKDPNELPGQRLNTKAEDEPIRTDEQGRVWYQEEVLKPSFAQPRGRRVLDYIDTGVAQATVRQGGEGNMTETFEVAGTREKRAQAKITLPSYQVGQYRHRNFPFLIHCYNELEGFDFFEVNAYWGGESFVPAGCKRMYVENVLCYDIRTTVAEIQMEDRRLQLASQGRGVPQ